VLFARPDQCLSCERTAQSRDGAAFVGDVAQSHNTFGRHSLVCQPHGRDIELATLSNRHEHAACHVLITGSHRTYFASIPVSYLLIRWP
jgi:hypothetical protein